MLRIVHHIYRFIFARPFFRRFNVFMFEMSLKGLGIINYENDKVSGERYFIRHILPKIVKKQKPLFFDIGANVGNYSRSLLDNFPGALIYLFEPHPVNFSALEKNITSSNIRLCNVALGECSGKLVLYDRADKDGSSHASLHQAVISEIHKKGVVEYEVSVETMDGICERETIGEIDFVKIDTEGNELAVLRGARELIENRRIKCIHFEFNEMNVISRVFFRDFRKTLPDFVFYRLLPKGLLLLGDSPLSTELFAFQNIIAIPKDTQI